VTKTPSLLTQVFVPIFGVVGLFFLWSTYRLIWNLAKFGKKEPFMELRIGFRIWTFILNVIGQRKLFKDWKAGTMHALIFWGFLAFGLYTTATFALALDPTLMIVPGGLIADLVLGSVDLFALLVAASVVYAMYRRWIVHVPRLRKTDSVDAAAILGMILALMLTYFALRSMDLRGLAGPVPVAVGHEVPPTFTPISSVVSPLWPALDAGTANLAYYGIWWVHVGLLLAFVAYIPHSKHLHIMVAPFNVLLTTTNAPGELPRLDLEKEGEVGAGRIEDLSWKQMLDLYACTECGRCTASCPANLTGKTLSPKDVILDLKAHLLEKGDAMRTGNAEGMAATKWVQLPGGVIRTDDLWSCTTCMACVEECPVFIDHVRKIVDMRRHLVLAEGSFPEESLGMLKNIETNYNPWGLGWDQRANWAEGLGVRRLSDAVAAGETVDVLYWVGCAASFDDRNRKVAQTFVRLLQKAGVNFAILGAEEKCTGDPARRLGNEYLAQTMIKANVETLNRYAIRTIVTACPHCFNTLKNEYPDFGGRYDVVHHSVFLDRLIKEGRLTPTKEVQEFLTYHDPCYLGRYNKVYDEPRDVLQRLPGVTTVEMHAHRSRAMCCGAGGARMWMDETVGEKVNHRRLEHVIESGAKAVAVACPYCLIMLDDAAKTKNREEIARLDIAELVERSL
jgi:Fe-S oxidoreductase